MAKKKTTTKSYKKRNFNKIANNYVKFNCTIQFRCFSTAEYLRFSISNLTSIPMDELLQISNDYGKLRQMYQFMRITGIGMTVVFMGADSYKVGGQCMMMGYLTTNDGTSIGDVAEADHSIILSPTDGYKTSTYIKCPNGGSWIDTSKPQELPGKIVCAQTGNAVEGTAYWVIKLKIYMTFKFKN